MRTRPQSRARPFRAVFAVPLAMGALSLIGLVSALGGDGLVDWLSWGALAVPALTVLWAMRARRT